MAHFSYRPACHAETGWPTIRLSCQMPPAPSEKAVAQFSPQVGSNLLQFAVDGREYIYAAPTTGAKLVFLGTPVLYPMPNRVRHGRFTFGGQAFQFEPNNNGNFIHGLVRDIPWETEPPLVGADSIAVRTHIRFARGKAIYDLFPIRNTLALTHTLKPDAARLDFQVTNEDSRPLPFGLAIHPYFHIHGPREGVRLQVPARKWMEAEQLLPTGRLLDLNDGPADLRQPVSLDKLNLDDVFWGMVPDKPAVIYYDALGKKLTLTASELFTHSVVFTPKGMPYFCIENQSCSTDAHNLYAQGLQEAAHLTILEPGQTLTAWIEITVSDL